MRFKCKVSYDGTLFHGFQAQNNQRTIQGVIEEALLEICKRKIRIHPSGRTDKGAHALGQVFHFDTEINIADWSLKKAINSLLPSDVYIKDVKIASDDFHARYDAKSKEYRYIIDLNEYNPLENNYRYFYKYKIDSKKIKDASKIFVGRHDFNAFTKTKNKNTIRTIYSIDFKTKNNVIYLDFHGDGFLHNMVRIIVGMLLEVGRGKIDKADLKHILESKNRQLALKIVPASGLYLVNVKY